MRIRTIKPEFWMHEGIASCSEFARLLAIALLNWSDDEGYFMANPILIRGQVFPFLDDSKIIPRSLQDLSRVGWICLGKDDQGRDVGMVKNFTKHQRVDKPKPSSIKANFQFQDASKIDPRLIQDASKEEGNGMEGNGKGKDLSSKILEREIAESIYKEYPRHEAKKTGIESILKAMKSHDPSFLMERTKTFARLTTWKEANFIPLPATFFNQERFNDDENSWKMPVKSEKTFAAQMGLSAVEFEKQESHQNGNLAANLGLS